MPGPDLLPTEAPSSDDDFARIERAILYVVEHRASQPGLDQVAAAVGLSAAHLQRLFTRWAGISPKRFLQFLSVEYAKRRMAETADLLSLSLDTGLSGPGRLHDLFVGMEAMSPGEYRRAAAGMTIRYGTGPTPFGDALIAISPRGVCHLSFASGIAPASAEARFRDAWPDARRVHAPQAAAEMLARIFSRAPRAGHGVALWVSGSNFQVQVWRALLAVPAGGLLSYRQLATLIGRPDAARAVGTAVAKNPVGYLIPCHRVLRDNGDFGAYHWGSGRKRAICGWEAAVSGGDDTRP